MSYAPVFVFPPTGFGVGAAEQCQGGEVSESGTGERGDHCCAANTWTAKTYRDVKGYTSWRRWAEKRIRDSLVATMQPDAALQVPTQYDAVAWDQGLPPSAVDPALLARINSARRNFEAAFPANRWYEKPGFKAGLYPSRRDPMCGPYDVWRSRKVPATPERAALISRLAGVTVTVDHLSKVELEHGGPRTDPTPGGSSLFNQQQKDPEQLAWESLPPALRLWAARSKNVIDNFPEARTDAGLGSYKKRFSVGAIVAASGDMLVPRPWLADFLDVFSPFARRKIGVATSRRIAFVKPSLTVAPKRVISTATFTPSAPTKPQPAPAPSVAQPPTYQRGQQQPSTDQRRASAEPSKGLGVALVVGGVTVLGVTGYVLWRRKR